MPCQASIFDGSRKFVVDKRIRLIELFGGIGSQAKALKNIQADFEHYKLCEIDRFAVKSYNTIHETDFSTCDVTKLRGSDLEIDNVNDFVYLLTYSFPCTDLSGAGKRLGMSKSINTRSGLLWEVERLLIETKQLPQVLLMENVPEILNQKNIKDFVLWRDFLESLGYKCYIKCLNAKHYGIPQNRVRCFMVSILGDFYYVFPERIPLRFSLKDFLIDDVDAKYFLSQKTIKHFYSRNIGKLNFKFKPKYKEDIASTITTRPDRHTETFIIEQEDASFLPNLFPAPEAIQQPCAIENETAYGFRIGCSTAFEPTPMKNFARTLTAQNNGNAVIYNGTIRKLTPQETFRLMGFSDEDFYRCKAVEISNAQLYKQAGNSIVVKVLEAIFKNMYC